MERMMWAVPFAFVVVVGARGTAPEADAARSEQEPACAPMVDRMSLEGRRSPYDSVAIAVGQGMAKVCYGRPSLRGRTMIGGEAVPYGSLWRTGANEPTTLHINVAASVAGIEVEPGSYSLYTVPREGGTWTLIVNRSLSQWGHEGAYTEAVEAQEVGRADVTVETLDTPTETLTFHAMDGGGGLILEWQRSRVRIPITAG
jgi:hypothetical protein